MSTAQKRITAYPADVHIPNSPTSKRTTNSHPSLRSPPVNHQTHGDPRSSTSCASVKPLSLPNPPYLSTNPLPPGTPLPPSPAIGTPFSSVSDWAPSMISPIHPHQLLPQHQTCLPKHSHTPHSQDPCGAPDRLSLAQPHPFPRKLLLRTVQNSFFSFPLEAHPQYAAFLLIGPPNICTKLSSRRSFPLHQKPLLPAPTRLRCVPPSPSCQVDPPLSQIDPSLPILCPSLTLTGPLASQQKSFWRRLLPPPNTRQASTSRQSPSLLSHHPLPRCSLNKRWASSIVKTNMPSTPDLTIRQPCQQHQALRYSPPRPLASLGHGVREQPQ